MKMRLIRTVWFVSVMFSADADAQGLAEHRACALSTLNGAYGFVHDGIVFGQNGHMAEVGIIRFDGKGHWSHNATLVSQGEVRRITSRDGVYTVNPNCTGSSELKSPENYTFDFVILDNGKELMQIATRTDRMVTWDIRQQSPERCSNAIISGSYALHQTGFDAEESPKGGVGVATFDGKGTWSLTLTEVNKDRPILHIVNPNGTYVVNGDCSGAASLAKTPVGLANWAFVIAGEGEAILQVATTPQRGAIVWVLKRQFAR